MKKSKLLSLSLALALVFTTVFAGTESIFAGTKISASSSAMTALEDAAGSLGTDTNPVVAVNINSDTEPVEVPVTYSKSAPGKSVVTVPEAGVVVFNISIQNVTTVSLYDSPSTESTAIAEKELYQYNQTVYFIAKKAGTYYLKFETENIAPITAQYQVAYAPAGNTALKNKKEHFAASLSSTKYYRYKVKTTKTGYLTVDFTPLYDNSTYTVRITNSKKKVISGAEKVNYNKNFAAYAGLPKGTYYVEVKTADPLYGIRVTAKYPKENSGSSKAKAKLMSKGIVKKGVITATQSSKSADWYKIKLNGNQPVDLTVNTLTGGNGGLRVSVYDTRKSKPFATVEHFDGDPIGVWNLFSTINDVKMNYLVKGTYYIKVTKYGKGNGYYELSWK